MLFRRWLCCVDSSSRLCWPLSNRTNHLSFLYSGLWRHTPVLLRPRILSAVKQKPLFPGMFKHVKKFDGEHTYHYAHHTFTIARESAAICILPLGCLFAYVAMFSSSFSSVPIGYQLLYFAALCMCARIAAAGKRNHCLKDLTGRRVVITGGTSGIGKAVAAQLAGMGADVLVLSRDGEHVVEAMQYIRRYAKYGESQRICFHAVDLADFIAVRDFCKRASQEGLPIDILVNNAGVIQQHHATTRFGDDVQLAVNFLGPFLLTEGLLPLVKMAQGRIVYVSCSAHVGVRGSVVSTYLSGRGVWSPRVAGKFDGLEQYGFTKLGAIYHTQDLALRSYPEPAHENITVRLTTQADPKLKPALLSPSGRGEETVEPVFTTCACTPGGVMTNLYRNVPFAFSFRWLYPLYLLFMRTAWEGSQSVVNCCVRDELVNGGYYMNNNYRPTGLSYAACSSDERNSVMAWTRRKMKPYMHWK